MHRVKTGKEKQKTKTESVNADNMKRAYKALTWKQRQTPLLAIDESGERCAGKLWPTV